MIEASVFEIANSGKKVTGFGLYNFGKPEDKISESYFSNILNQKTAKYQSDITSGIDRSENRKDLTNENIRKKLKKKDIKTTECSAINVENSQYANVNKETCIKKDSCISGDIKTKDEGINKIKEVKQKLAEISVIQSKAGSNPDVNIEETQGILDFLKEQNMLPEYVFMENGGLESVNIEDMKLLLEGLKSKLENQEIFEGSIANVSLDHLSIESMIRDEDSEAIENLVINENEIFTDKDSEIKADSSEAYRMNTSAVIIETGEAVIGELDKTSELTEEFTDISEVAESRQAEENIKLDSGTLDAEMSSENEETSNMEMYSQENQDVFGQQDASYKGFAGILGRYNNNFFNTLYENSASPESQSVAARTGIFVGNISSDDIISQVVEKAKTFITEEKSQMLIEMKPDILGKVTLKVLTENDIVKAEFYAESIQVKEILEANFQALKDNLEESGFSIQEFSVSVQDQRTGNDTSNSQRNWNSKTSGKGISSLSSVKLVGNYGLAENDTELDNWNWAGSKLNLMA